MFVTKEELEQNKNEINNQHQLFREQFGNVQAIQKE